MNDLVKVLNFLSVKDIESLGDDGYTFEINDGKIIWFYLPSGVENNG